MSKEYPQFQDDPFEREGDALTRAGFTERELTRIGIIEEAAEMRKTAVESGGDRHLLAIDRLEEQALRLTDENYKEEANG
jgi:hypothetical protein